MNANHTPGPWRVVPCFDGWGMHSVESEVFGEHSRMKDICLLDPRQSSFQPDDQEALANARLIAAAPELLIALQSIVMCCEEEHAARDYVSRQTEIRGIARAAIAKAKATGSAA